MRMKQKSIVIQEATKVSLGANESYGIYLIDKLRQRKLPISRINKTTPVLSGEADGGGGFGRSFRSLPCDATLAPESRLRNEVSFCHGVIRTCDVWHY